MKGEGQNGDNYCCVALHKEGEAKAHTNLKTQIHKNTNPKWFRRWCLAVPDDVTIMKVFLCRNHLQITPFVFTRLGAGLGLGQIHVIINDIHIL